MYQPKPRRPSTRVIYCGDNLDQLRKLPDGCIDLIYIDPSLAQAGTPEIREYRIRAVIDDEEIGDYSVTKQVTVS